MDHFVLFVILLVIHAVILGLALAFGMYLKSFQFGVLSVFTAKAAALLVAVTLVRLFVPFWVALPVWFVGFWLLLEIDPRDSLILTGVVLVLNFLVNYLILAALLSRPADAAPAP